MSELINYFAPPEGSMTLERLDARGKVLSDSLRSIEHGTERREQIKHELGNIAFELYCRYNAGEIDFEPTSV